MPTTAPTQPLDDVVAAVAVLRDPAMPGEPWTVEEIARMLPMLAEGPSVMEVEATTVRWLDAIRSGACLPPDE